MIGTEINTLITKHGEFESNESYSKIMEKVNLAVSGESQEVEGNEYAMTLETVIREKSYAGKLVEITETVTIDFDSTEFLFLKNQVVTGITESKYDEIKRNYPSELQKIKDLLTPSIIGNIKMETKKRMMQDTTIDITEEVTEEVRKDAYDELAIEIKRELDAETTPTKK